MKIERDSVADRVAEQLRMLIISGKLLPGEKIVEEELCKEMEISRTPLREAFRVLQVEGFLSHKPRCGVTVASYTINDIEELWDLRTVLEATAASRAARQQHSGIKKELNDMVNGSRLIQEYDSYAFSEHDTNFHVFIAKCSGNKWFENELINLWKKSSLPRRVLLRDIESAKKSCQEHERIVRAIENGDVVGAYEAMEQHMKNSLERIKGKLNTENLL